MTLSRTIQPLPDMQAVLPVSADDYYALIRAEMDRPGSEVHRLCGGVLTVDYSQSWQYRYCVSDSSGGLFDGIPQLHDFPVSDEIMEIDQAVALVDDRFTKFNVCHFLLDKLYRVTEYKGLNVDSFLLFDKNDYVRKVSGILGLPLVELPPAESSRVSYRFKELYVSSSVFRYKHPGQNFRPELLAMLEKLQDNIRDQSGCSVTGQSASRIYVDRSGGNTRMIENVSEFRELLQEYQFESVFLEDLEFEEQVHLFRHADVVLGVHGAGLTNMVFNRKPNSQLLEILPPLCATGDYWKLASAYGFHYDAFIARDPEHSRPDYGTWEHNPARFNRQNVVIDCDEFSEFLKLNIHCASAASASL